MLDMAAARMAGHLNALTAQAADTSWVAAMVRGSDVAHHVVDPDAVCDLDPEHAVELAEALPALVAAERHGWVLALPRPGALGLLRGPSPLNRAALGAGAVVIGVSGRLALVPHSVGPAVQWRVYRAEPPGFPPSPYEAERALAEAVLAAERALAGSSLGTPGLVRPAAEVDLPPGLSSRQVAAADRAARLLLAVESALRHDGAGLGTTESAVRAASLRAVRTAAADALSAAVSRRDGDGPDGAKA